MDKKRAAVILAAGMGTRLRPLTDSEHKCMTKVCGTPIILQTLSVLKKYQIEEAVIVVGYLRERLQQQIKEFGIDGKINFAINEIYEQTNTGYSLKKGMEKLDKYDELYVIEGDVFFEEKVLERLVYSLKENATILEPNNDMLDGTFVECNDSGYVVDWRHKSEQQEGYVLWDKFKTVNLHKFSREFAVELLWPKLEDCERPECRKLPIEKIMREIVTSQPKAIYGEVLRGEKWWEIDDVDDLKTAERLFGKEKEDVR